MWKKIFLIFLTVVLIVTSLNIGLISVFAAGSNELEYSLNADKQSYCVVGIGNYSGSEIIIPETYNNLPVTTIKEYAFQGNEQITKVSISKNIVKIGDYAFTRCENISKITVDGGNLYYHSQNNCLIETSLKKVVLGCQSSIIPDDGSVITIGKASFYGSKKLTSIVIPNNVKTIESSAFHLCWGLKELTLGSNLETIGTNAFMDTDITEIKLPNSLRTMGQGAFYSCTNLSEVTIPGGVSLVDGLAFGECSDLKTVKLENGVKHIGGAAFRGCTELVNIELPNSLRSIGYYAFGGCSKLENAIYYGTESDWQSVLDESENENLKNALVFAGGQGNEQEPLLNNGFIVFSDISNTSIKKGGTITVGVAAFKDGLRVTDLSGITFSIENSSIIHPKKTTVENNNYYVELSADSVGRTFITFTDSKNEFIAKIPITVFQDNYHSYTLNSVPSEQIEKYTSNFYNVNGLYVDEYKCEVKSDGSASVSFDIYNTNNIYGTVEVYNSNGDIVDIIVIDKMQEYSTSIKESVWDNSWFIIRDALDGDFLTYRQESGFSKHTPVSVIIPRGGYLTINMDTDNFLPCVINIVDVFKQIVDLMGIINKAENYNGDSREFAETLSKKLLFEELYKEAFKNKDEVVENLNKNIAKSIILSKESMGGFVNTISKNLSELDMDKIIVETVSDFGCEIGQDVFVELAGPVGLALKGIFFFSDCGNVVAQFDDYQNAQNVGVIVIQNQGGGIRASSEIKVESKTSFDEDVALNIFKVTPSIELLEQLKAEMPNTYTEIRDGMTYTYNISLIKGGEEIQHSDDVTVYIPIPPNLIPASYANKVKVYRMEENGALTEMNTTIESGCLVFTTEHFSLYFVVGDRLEGKQPVGDPLDYSYDILESGTARITNYLGSDTFVRLPETYNGYPITHIGEFCFSNKSIEKIVIHSGVKHIGSYVFDGCDKLSTIYYLGLESEWNEINIDSNNDLTNINIIFDVSMDNGNLKIPEKKPDDSNNDNNGATIQNPPSIGYFILIPIVIVLIAVVIIVLVFIKKRKPLKKSSNGENKE